MTLREMSGNPRKFSEKIAIHQRKLNEEQNAFESIMGEVSAITRGQAEMAQAPNADLSGSWSRAGGSLPNVYHLTQQPQVLQPVDPMSIYSGQWGPGPSAVGFFGGGSSGNSSSGEVMSGQRMPNIHSRGRSPGAGGGGHAHHTHSHTYHPYRTVSPQHVSPGAALPTRQQSPERPQMTPPYPGTHMYLVPPQDTNWRRTHSDPGIHASVMHPTIPGQPNAHAAPAHTPPQNNVSPTGSPIGDKSSGYYLEPKVNAPQYRPRSCDNVPNINIHPSEPVAGPQVPISNNTGSLPDLPSSLLPTHAQIQQLEGVMGGQPPPYTQAIGASQGSVGSPTGGVPAASVGPHQQRHSIQLPVQYSQGFFGGGGPKYVPYGVTGQQTLGSQAYSHGSPFYQPESPRSAPNSPHDAGGSGDSPVSSPQAQAQSPGSPYYSLHTQMQNINIDSQEPIVVSPQNAYYNVGNSYNVSSMQPSNAYQQYTAMPAQQMSDSQDQYRQQMYQAFLLRQQQVQGQFHHGGQMQQSLASPNSGQIPDIIFTGADGSISASGVVPNMNSAGGYMDPTVEILSSDLRISLDPVDLESLHGLSSEQGLNIDAASEDELRRDRV